MFAKVVTTPKAGPLVLPAGQQFSLAPISAAAVFPLTVKPNGQDTDAFEYQEERTLGLSSFNTLEIHGAKAGSMWLAYVAGPGEMIGRGTPKPVQLFDVQLLGKTLPIPDPQVEYTLPDLRLSTMLAPQKTWFRLTPFRRVIFQAFTSMLTPPNPFVGFSLERAMTNSPLPVGGHRRARKSGHRSHEGPSPAPGWAERREGPLQGGAEVQLFLALRSARVSWATRRR